ncbi:CAP domain-containing protein [Deinococcus ruber]|uniref:SCP domain-containing protein n=1 Tax=Deinococcus ruber TaxID=1848197 RepID=A0A918F7S3_9DEIO|nr:CAP domain-containing protein [Deinococcus ruber]GGR13331.1 hypothetical protein GCM10008957_27860 [Deinococcus ruber]
MITHHVSAARWLLGAAFLLGACAPAPTPKPGFEVREMTAQSQAVFVLTNQQRAQGTNCQGVAYPVASALVQDQTLTAAAQHRADDLAQTEDFSHFPSNGKTYLYWLGVVHFDAAFPARQHYGENLGMADTPSQVIAAWLASTQGHCEAQFTATYQDTTTHQWMPGFTHIGVGDALSAVSGRHYWVVLFAN